MSLGRMNLHTFSSVRIGQISDKLLFIFSKFNTGRCNLRQYSNIINQCIGENSTKQIDNELPSYPQCLSWTDPNELAHYLSQHVVALSEHFVVIDKPPNLSVWGHSLTTREACSVINPKAFSPSSIGVNDCLQHLSSILTSWEENQPKEKLSNKSKDSHGTVEIPKLHIIEALPAAYSGLILLGRNEKYTTAARQFYKSAIVGGAPWELYQRLLVVCWGRPHQMHSKTSSFPIASYPLNDHLRVGYRPSADEISTGLKRKGVILQKRVKHTTIAESDNNNNNSSLVELETNSTFRGLPEVYLLYEGCSVVGETFQASRLVNTGVFPVVLHPSKIRLDYTLPAKQRQLLSHANTKPEDIPVHIHRSHLYLPIPFYTKSHDLCIRPYVKNPSHIFKNKHVKSPLDLSSSLSLSHVKSNDSPDHATDFYFLTCSSSNLPPYFSTTLNRLGLEFDYTSWLKAKHVNIRRNNSNNNNDNTNADFVTK
ncbi:unnamed protein product [Trichobilharzia szidati]|nr:unnamed protein product [Trichobilharzia szidati]